MKKILLKIVNKYSLIYSPIIWTLGVGIISILYKPLWILNFLTVLAILISFLLYYKYTVLEYYSDYWLGCTASKFIVDEFKKENPEIPIVSINASKKEYKEIIEKYRLKFTPTYVLVDSDGERIHKRTGSFSKRKFNSLIN